MHILYKSKYPISLGLENGEVVFEHGSDIPQDDLEEALVNIKIAISNMITSSLPFRLPDISEYLYFNPTGFYQASNITLRQFYDGFVFNNVKGDQFFLPSAVLKEPDEYGKDDGAYYEFDNGVRVPTPFVRWFSDIEFCPAIHITPALQVSKLTDNPEKLRELARFDLSDYLVTVQDIKDEGTWLYIEKKRENLNFACNINLFVLKTYSADQWKTLFDWHSTLTPQGLPVEYLPEIVREAEYFKYIERVSGDIESS